MTAGRQVCVRAAAQTWDEYQSNAEMRENMATSLDGLLTSLQDLSMNTQRTNTSEEKKSRNPGGDLGKEEFLQLLVCQMRNQDPLEPAKDTEFIAQLAQFSALEQMQNLNETVVNSQAFSLVGKYVLINTTDSDGRAGEVAGVVDCITMKGGETYMTVNGQQYSMDQLVEVRDEYYAVQEYLPSVEKMEAVYDKSNKAPVYVPIDLGKNSYAATSVAVFINGEAVSPDYLKYDEATKELSIWPGFLDNLEAGVYQVAFVFDDLYATTISDKVTIQVTDSGVSNEDSGVPNEDSGVSNEDSGVPNEE